MKSLVHINEYLIKKKLNKSIVKEYKYAPKNSDELIDIIIDLLSNNEHNLNCIDVSNIRTMQTIFYSVNRKVKVTDIDISEWDVSNIKVFDGMFMNCENINCDISNWDVSSAEDMNSMFAQCHNFNCDLSKWNVGKCEDMNCMFEGCWKFNCDLSNWDVSNVYDMYNMFGGCVEFEGEGLDKWDKLLRKDVTTMMTFNGCKKLKKIPSWYKG